MDIWENSNNSDSMNERTESGARYANGSSSNGGGVVRNRRGHQESKDSHVMKDYPSSRAINSDCDTSSRDKRQKKSDGIRKNDYDTRGRQEVERSSRYANGEDRHRESGRRKHEADRHESVKQEIEPEESEGDETEGQNDEEETYGNSSAYKEEYDAKKYYDERSSGHREESSRRYREDNRRDDHKYDNEKSESESTTTDSEDASTITIPETGRKVEHIAQKLEQTAQKYAREHSPPKFTERRRGVSNDSEYKQQQQQQQMSVERDDKPPPSYERAYENSAEARSRQSQRFERIGYSNESGSNKQQSRSSSSTLGTGISTYERTFEKNPERKRNVAERASTSRRFEQRPRPPFEDAPERPTERTTSGGFRERRYSDKEEIYGETGRYTRDPGTLEKDRGYESNFETKLERNKVIEKVQQVYRSRADGGAENPRSNTIGGNNSQNPEVNDNNNNTLKNERKNMLPRQTTTLGHLVQTGRAFDLETKSPKLVKRTKSFWRFRRDSDVLEGMALWQHRSLVDIPKMLKRESTDDKTKDEPEITRKLTPEGSPGSDKSIGKESRSSDNTLTNEDHRTNHHQRHRHESREREQRQEEPKPAERMHVPDKTDYFESDFPTPAERPKLVERSEYRMHREERSMFVGNVSRKAIIEKERKRSLEAKRNMVVAELKENNEAKKGDRRNKTYGDEDDGLMQNFSEIEASDEESTYSCIIVKDQPVTEKTLLPRTKLRRDSDRERDKNTCGPWYDLWGVDTSVPKKKNK